MRLKRLFLYGDKTTITTRTQTGTDAYGDPIITESSKTVRGAFSPTDTIEDLSTGSHQVVDRPNVLLPPTAVIDSNCTVTIDGTEWQVRGDPQLWRNPRTGWVAGIKAYLYTTKG